MSKNTRSRNISKLIILALVLFVPGFLYIMVNQMGSNEYVKLTVFGKKELSGKMNRVMGREIPDTIFHTVSPFEFVNFDGKPIQFLSTDTVISVIHLFYAKDDGLSKQLLYDMNGIAKRFKENNKIRLYSISVDSTDQSDVLVNKISEYRDGMNPHWYVGNRTSVDIFDYARRNLLIEAMPDSSNPHKFIISNQFVLIDSKGRIRGFYDVGLRSEVDRLEDEIKVQLVEEIRNSPLKVERK